MPEKGPKKSKLTRDKGSSDYVARNYTVRAAALGLTLCAHCGKGRINRPRGLCWNCYYTPGVKELHPSTSKYAKRGIGNGQNFDPPFPAQPTTHAPGTPGKLALLEQRAKDRVAIFHPADARFEGDALPVEFINKQLLNNPELRGAA